MQIEVLFGKKQTQIFGLFFLNKNGDFTAAEVARELKIPHSTAREWLQKLEAGKALIRQKRGNLKLFRLNQKSPIFSELEKIVTFVRQEESQRSYDQNKIRDKKLKNKTLNSKKVFKKIPEERKFPRGVEILHSVRNGKNKSRWGGFSAPVRLKLKR
ncbi:MAG: winged helix-turn-helix domain-containing protein [Patescibacteria group bacterium]